ncbi:hypothetical protein LTR10_016841 [Elasticomyces elasticus]|uniref:Ribosome assembly protein 3 n=1 Tax=Exophiala sideris TaxID=1016849 RepID=A0ABR0JK03_9EURO|nr:hypothetical protein LTR10_016841 [Elasticomyces elasticus]KAK5035389.1 hypothetical protein LTS07_002826 [Exophiala sideris]KAK5039260.1 hypothetical protein LTR13_003516 [Exophiala sideris]KAK5066313.1 hypothetical protein LTR69_002832 [Exophiala sideris]KAK5186990.1 hypothetical protein LTR44_000997 [Eurotiomycetes sp. CCFEE 6388]
MAIVVEDPAAAIELDGFALQVADAANKAGFNTFNHEALYNLIWAVKRVALHSGVNRFGHHPPPRHPIYPDRYRPSGVRDNTKKKKKNKALAIKPPPNHTVELKFHPVEPLMRKRPHDTIAEENLIDLTTSSEDGNTTDIKSSPTGAAKRQKTSDDTTVKAFPNAAQDTVNTLARRVNSVKQPQKAAVKTVRPPPANIVRPPPATVEDEIAKQLLLVKTKLDDARKSMNTCQATMKSLFDVYYEKFDDDQLMVSLQKLSNLMNKVFDGSKDGAVEVERVIESFGEKKSGIL